MDSNQRYIDNQYEWDWEGYDLTELFDAEIAGIDEDWSEDYKLRAELDFRTGRAITRLQTNKLRQAIPEYQQENKIIYYGSCMFPVLGFVCDQTHERGYPFLTEENLRDFMERNSIGWPSTYVGHIRRSIECGYIEKYDRIHLRPTPLGLAIIEGYNQIFTNPEESPAKPILRATFEESLADIRDGSRDFEEVREEQIEKYRRIFETVRDNFETIISRVRAHLHGGGEALPPREEKLHSDLYVK